MQIAKSKTILLSFSTLRKPKDIDVFVKASGKDLRAVMKELMAHYPAYDPALAKDKSSQSMSPSSHQWTCLTC